MTDRQVVLYFAWSREAEAAAPLTVIDDRFPAIFELRRLFYPDYEALAGAQVDQGVAGFLEHVQKRNFETFAAFAEAQTGRPIRQFERGADDGAITALDDAVLAGADTVVVISFDSLKTAQTPRPAEIEAVRRFLDDPDHVLFVCPHHDIGEIVDAQSQLVEHRHHGDRATPPRQGFGGFARHLLAGLGAPVENRFGLRPGVTADGAPAPISIDHALDALDLFVGVGALHLHPHLPQLERIGEAAGRLGVLVRQPLDMAAPPHPFIAGGRSDIDAVLQSKAEAFAGTLLVCDATLFSATAGGLENLKRFWSNLIQRPRRS